MDLPQRRVSTSELPAVDRRDNDPAATSTEVDSFTQYAPSIQQSYSSTQVTEQRDIEKQIQDSQSRHSMNADRRNSCTSDIASPGSELVDFDGPDDPNNPYNWSKSKKWVQGGLLSVMSFITPVASTMFAPGVPAVMSEFKTSNETLGSLVVSIYLLGFAFGPLVIAPLSEIHGRNPVYHVSNLLFVVFTIACAVSSSIGMLIGFRFLAGIAGATIVTIGSASIADMFLVHERGAAMALWGIGGLLGPVIGPIAGGYLAASKGWRWTFWLISILAGATSIAILVVLRETYAPVLLRRKAMMLSKATGRNLKSKLSTTLTPGQFMVLSLTRPMRMLALSPIVFLMSLYMAVVYGYLYLLFTTMTTVFQGVYHFSASNVGLAYLGIGIGMFIGLAVFGKISDKLIQKLAAQNNGVMEPEYRLPPMIPAALIVPAGLFLYGWTAQYKVQYIVPIIGTALVGVGLMSTFLPTLNYLVDAYTQYAASVTAANIVFRSLFGALLPLAGPKMYAALGFGWGNSLLAFVAIALAPTPYIFWKYGKAIRTKSTVEW